MRFVINIKFLEVFFIMKNLFGKMNKMGRNDDLGAATERKNNKTHGKNFSERKTRLAVCE